MYHTTLYSTPVICSIFNDFELFYKKHVQEDEVLSQKHPLLKHIWSNFGKPQPSRTRKKAENKINSSRRWECEECGYTTTNSGHFTVHKKIHNKQDRIQCDHCSYSAARNWHMKEHVKHAHADAATREYEQDWLPKVFSSESPSVWYLIWDRFKAVTKCPHCPKKLLGSYSLKVHIDDIHLKLGFRCHDCKITFPKRTELFTHRRDVHKTRGNHKCDQCDFLAEGKQHLADHRRSKHDNTRLFCTLCSYSTTVSTQFNHHLDVKHSGISYNTKKKQFQCPECDHYSERINSIDMHRAKAHGISKVFTCGFCEATFNSRPYVRRHWATCQKLIEDNQMAIEPKAATEQPATIKQEIKIEFDDSTLLSTLN